MAESLEQAAQQSFPRTASCLPEIFAFMDRFFAQTAVSDEHRLPMQFVVEEWFTNLVKYSRGATHDILFDMKRQDGRLVLSLTDFGVERFDIRDRNLARVEAQQDRIIEAMPQLARQARYHLRESRDNAVFYQQAFRLDEERRSQQVGCWQDVSRVMRDFLDVWEAHQQATVRGRFLQHAGQ